MDVGPMRLRHGGPMAIGFEAPIAHEIRLPFDLRDATDRLLAQPGGKGLRFNIADEAIFIFRVDEALNGIGRCIHNRTNPVRL